MCDLTVIPGVGVHIAADLEAIGIHCVADLKGKDPEKSKIIINNGVDVIKNNKNEKQEEIYKDK